jgi:hypothetical protein
MLDLYLIYLEMKDLGIGTTEHNSRVKEWHEYMKTKLPNKVRFTILPLFFNYTNETSISNFIEENCAGFIKSFAKNQTFVITCKLFEYPNRIMSVRFIISVFIKIGENERTQSSNIDANVYQNTDFDRSEKNDMSFEDESEQLLD